MTKTKLTSLVYQMECLYGFPKSDDGILAITRVIHSLAGDSPDSEQKAQWLIDRLLMGAPRFPTPIEMRRVYCQKYTPADGLEDTKVDLSDLFTTGSSFTKKLEG